MLVDFLASRYASLTTKSNHFVWSITSRNLNQFQRQTSLYQENIVLLVV